MRLYHHVLLSFGALVLMACAAKQAAPQTDPMAEQSREEAELRQNSRDFSAGNSLSVKMQNGVPAQTTEPAKVNPESQNFKPANSAPAKAAFQAPAEASRPAVLPTIVVIPAGAKNIRQGMELVSSNSFAQTSQNAINEYLTKRQYNVLTPDVSSKIEEIASLQSEIAGQDEDLSYIASLSFGADIYIKFSSDIHRDQIFANLSAYESSTGRLLGSQSSTVNDNGTNKNELVASAMHKALPGLLKKIEAYWAEDSKYGLQYKVIVRFTGDYSNADDIHSSVLQAFKQAFPKVQINTMTDKTADFSVYANPQETADAYEVYDRIRQALGTSFQLKKNNISKKLILMEIR